MIKKIIFLSIYILIFSFNFCIAPSLSYEQKKNRIEIANSEIIRLEWEKEFSRFKKDLGYQESGDNWTIYNTIGCIGTYQFQIATLDYLGYSGITFEKFKTNPEIFPVELQEEVLRALIRDNELALKQFEPFIGKTIDGVLITWSGLVAGAHLGGVGGVKAFLLGIENMEDLNGASIRGYIEKFQGYSI